MSTVFWDFAALDFTVLNDAQDRDTLPLPLHHQPRYETVELYRDAITAAAQRVGAMWESDPNLRAAFASLHSCDMWAQMSGHFGADHEGEFRAHVAFHGDRVVFLHQDRLPVDGGDVRMIWDNYTSAGAGVALLLPGFTAGAEHLEVPVEMTQPIAVEDEDGIPESWWRAYAQWNNFTAQTLTGLVHLIVAPGPTLDYTPVQGMRQARLVVLKGGKGYLVRTTHGKVHVDGIDPAGLAVFCQAMFDAVRRDHRIAQEETTGGTW